MKKTLILIIISVIIAILSFVIFTKADYPKLTDSEALAIGEEKYLAFLWMVDGAFNNEKLNGEFVVNGKTLKEDNKRFTCIYKNKKDNSCVGKNFEEEFRRLFASNIIYDQVYGDGNFYSWFKYENGNYIFTNLDNCSVLRMDLNQSMEVLSIDNNTLTFRVIYQSDGHTKTKTKMFTLIKEDDDWKISKAYYHDICEMDYYIE